MNLNDKVLARKLFKLKIYEWDGQAFEDLFISIIQSKYPDFMPIEPSGKVGDRKNDGYRPDSGQYYQVYAPKEVNHKTRKAAAAKARKDFKGLKGFWGGFAQIREYHFVCNDKYEGSLAEVEQELQSLQSEYGLDKARPFLSKDLEAMLLELADDLIVEHIGLIPQAPVIGLDFSMLGEVVTHIHNNGKPISFTSDFSSLDFEEKIKFNNLSPQVRQLLEAASFHVQDIDTYFRKNSDFAKQRLRDEIQEQYAVSVKKFAGTVDSNVSDLVFFDLLNAIIPIEVGEGAKRRLQEAALVILSYYFEACDLFEHPQIVV